VGILIISRAVGEKRRLVGPLLIYFPTQRVTVLFHIPFILFHPDAVFSSDITILLILFPEIWTEITQKEKNYFRQNSIPGFCLPFTFVLSDAVPSYIGRSYPCRTGEEGNRERKVIILVQLQAD
jgi:hypothetical protein